MVFKYYKNSVRNDQPFEKVCNYEFGRHIITTTKNQITPDNICDELAKALPIHGQNAREIDYLDRYYRGDQPILYRQKEIRPEVNNRIVENITQYIVESKASDMAGEPITYVLHGTDKKKSQEVADLNTIMESEDKEYYDIELCRWRSICGVGYRFIGNNDGYNDSLMDEADFYFEVCDPRETFVAYYQNGTPAFGCMVREGENGETIYNVYTKQFFFIIQDGKIVSQALNGNKAIPIIEYPNNERRLSDIEITISISDELNRMASDRANGIEQFVSSWIKFVNCAIDKDLYEEMRQEGALVVKSNNGADNKADVDVISNELNQSETQVAVADLYEKLLVIQGLANRQATSQADTGSAVELRNGHFDAEKRAELSEPIFKKAERQMLRIVLNRLRITKGFTLLPSDVEVKISRTKTDNILTKTEALQMMLQSGIYPARAIKTAGIWSDPEQVAVESQKRMEILYPEEVTETVTTTVDENVSVDNNGGSTDE